MYTPVKVPRIEKGRIVAIIAYAKTSAEPLLELNQNTIAKLVIELVRADIICPDHINAKVLFQFDIKTFSLTQFFRYFFRQQPR
ncbi:hypothetical protein SDC9_137479 [bioreactor metagenome]|uniref:Uncharacterized protein n=1 Tax=bioreactor metagenome TaxID=1076179 RepID=A0A645DMN1_9ZZZZ